MESGEMIWAFQQLLNPLKYLRVQQGPSLFQSKAAYDWVLPLVFAAASEALIFACAPDIKVFSERGIVGAFQKLMEILVPFYIAALAAVATFERQGLDDVMKGQPATLRGRDAKGQMQDYILTRRQFI